MLGRTPALRAPKIGASVLVIALLAAVAPLGAVSAAPSSAEVAKGLWERVGGGLPDVLDGRRATIDVRRGTAFRLDVAGMSATLAAVPREKAYLRRAGKTLSIPGPRGGMQRFSILESPVMEPKLQRAHPEIRTFVGQGITDPTATIRLSLTSLGFHASVRGQNGPWFIDPYYHLDRRFYVSYFGNDLVNNHGPLKEVEMGGWGAEARALALAQAEEEGGAAVLAVGHQLRTYRLALATDPVYATAVGLANVTSAKAALINRVTHIYEDESSIRLVLVGNNDLLNFDTAALATGANGPCGLAPCYTQTLLDNGCDGAMLDRNHLVIGQIIGSDNFDIGHIGLGGGGGGVARGGVGGFRKAEGCTGVNPPIGDLFAVDYVAHEMGHQFTAPHTWSGVSGSCSPGQYAPDAAVEPGSGSSIMGYAGICGADDLQAHSDPYWSQTSFETIDAYVTSSQPAINEVQNAAFTNFDGTDSFTVTYNGNTSAAITRGTNYTAAGISAALLPILPAGATVSVSGFWGGTFDDRGFQVTFGGTLQDVDVPSLALTNASGFTGYINAIDNGGPIENQGFQVTPTGNSAPSVTAPGDFTIPVRTPFALTGSATDADADTLTYLWEQDDAAPVQGMLQGPAKAAGPLFRQFGVAQDAGLYDPQQYESPGENHPTTDPTRVFPDMDQILTNNTNAESGDCPGGPLSNVDCYSEFLPTAIYTGPMNFRLTARDGNPGGGGVNSADSTVNLATASGPFLVTSPNTAVTYLAQSTQTVTWDVALTDLPPVSTANVDIVLSTDGGETFSTVLASGTPNDGSQTVTVPDVDTTEARIMVRAVGNIFFDVSNEDFTIVREADMELVSKDDSPDPAFAGETITYTITARNNGPSEADNARVVDVLPPETVYESSSIPCTEGPIDTVTCGLGSVANGAEVTFTITVLTPADLVHNNGEPLTVTNQATAVSDRPDPDPANDSKSQDTLVKAKADLHAIDYEVVDPPTEIIIGETAQVNVEGTITNHGPSAPMDVAVGETASASPGSTVSPTDVSSTEAAVSAEEQREVGETYSISCEEPGSHTFTFALAIAPDRLDDIDPELSNNEEGDEFTVECIVPVAINIHPGSLTNPINHGSNGLIPLGVLTTEVGEYGLPLAFDATTIRPTTVRFGPKAVVIAGGGALEMHGLGHIEDVLEKDEVTYDGDDDMMLHFRTRQSQLTETDEEGCVRGEWNGPGNETFLFQGCDLVSSAPQGRSGQTTQNGGFAPRLLHFE